MLNDLLDALGYVGSALDKPGRALRGFMAGRPDEALAAVPFSDSLGITDPGRRTSGSDLLDALGVNPGGTAGDLAGFATEVATDPMTYLGMGAGRLLGKTAEGAAAARGPRYGTTADDLARMVDVGKAESRAGSEVLGLPPTPVMDVSGDARTAQFHLDQLMNSPARDRVLQEIPPDAKLLGSGVEALAFSTPDGQVLRVSPNQLGVPGRPLDPGVLPNTRAIDVGEGGRYTYRVERAPYAKGVGNADFASPEMMQGMAGDMGGRGLAFTDRHAGNVGQFGGRPVVIDPGAVQPTQAFQGGFQPVARDAQGSAPMNALLDALGGDPMIRSAIEQGQMGPDLARKLGGYGGFLGADLGAWGRTQTTR